MAEEETEKKESKLDGLKQNKMLLFIIIGVVALLLIILIVVAILLFSGGSDEEQVAATGGAQPAQVSAAEQGSKAKAGGNFLSVGPMVPLDQFIVNLMTSSGGKRYLKTTIALELSIADMQAEIENKRDVIRDTIITILSSKTFEEVQTARGKQKIKDELQERINEYLVDGRITNIFFTDFVVQ
ncbi:MAG: flagellar basal body-associated protein FliL [Helicobacter sp.]|nr:flagellar basal body-associated protein FliL [Helicobacter sp.]